MAVARNKYLGMSREELARERRVVETKIYQEKQRIASVAPRLLSQNEMSRLRSLDYDLTKIREAEQQLDM